MISCSRSFRVVAAVLIIAAVPQISFAQSTVTDVVGFLMTNQAVPTEDFSRDRAASEAWRPSCQGGGC